MQVNIQDVKFIHEQGKNMQPRVRGNGDAEGVKKAVCYIMEKHRNGVGRDKMHIVLYTK